MKHYRTEFDRIFGPAISHQESVIHGRREECWGCGEKRPLSELERIPFDNGIADEEAFYCLDNDDCQRKSGALKRWIR